MSPWGEAPSCQQDAKHLKDVLRKLSTTSPQMPLLVELVCVRVCCWALAGRLRMQISAHQEMQLGLLKPLAATQPVLPWAEDKSSCGCAPRMGPDVSEEDTSVYFKCSSLHRCVRLQGELRSVTQVLVLHRLGLFKCLHEDGRRGGKKPRQPAASPVLLQLPLRVFGVPAAAFTVPDGSCDCFCA